MWRQTYLEHKIKVCVQSNGLISYISIHKMRVLTTSSVATTHHLLQKQNAHHLQSSQQAPGSSLERRRRSKKGGNAGNGKLSLSCRASMEPLLSPDSFPLSIIPAIADSSQGGYSQASYYTSLGLFVISVPGIWSLIKRSTKSKVLFGHFFSLLHI